ncbi:hypothetical protein [Planktothrix pseudagardhii]|uniref:Uncharacterized protein n=1 Tax=Planktothrix pseudagardhii TaxID=132604 RepID=A0A9W4CSM0_9CYAN|nr:hypothetical protein [Planktothrix pseudagardhii]CAD5912047.1 hypothetical protein NO713_00103 [Planktothrix pseudagardhii]
MEYSDKRTDCLKEVAKKCDVPTFNKLDNIIPDLIRSDNDVPMLARTEKQTYQLIDNAINRLNIELDSPVAMSYMSAHPIELLEDCLNLESISWRGQIFMKYFSQQLAEDVKQRIKKAIDCSFDLSVLYGKEVPSLSRIILELLTIDPKLEKLILERAVKVHKECHVSEFQPEYVIEGEEWGFHYQIVIEGFANEFRQDLIDAVQNHNLTVFKELLSRVPLLKSLPQFNYKPQRLSSV